MPKVTSKRVKGICPTCGNKVSGTGRIYCDGCQPGIKTGRGYIHLYRPGHPRANSGGYVSEHLLVMEQKVGRPLKDKEVIHHIDGNPANNKPDNLMLFATSGKHVVHHALLRRRIVMSELLSITPDQWWDACHLDGREGCDQISDYFKSIGITNSQSIRRARSIVGRGHHRYNPNLWNQSQTDRKAIGRKFKSEFIQYALSEAARAKWQS